MEFLHRWYGLDIRQTESAISNDDLLIIMDVDQKAHPGAIRRADVLLDRVHKVGAGVLYILQPDARLPKDIKSRGQMTGSHNSYLNIFAKPVIENAVFNRKVGSIFIYGTEPRVPLEPWISCCDSTLA